MTLEAAGTRGSEERAEPLGDVPHEGFNKKTRKWLSGAAHAIGLPTKNIERVSYKKHTFLGDLFGKRIAEGVNKRSQLIRFIPGVRWLNLLISPHPYWLVIHSGITRDWVRRMEPASVLSHEMAHFCSPFNSKNDGMYGGRENRLRIADFVHKVLRQSIATGVYINTYHKHVIGARRTPTTVAALDRMSKNTVSLEETWTILVEQRFVPTDFDVIDANGKHPKRHLKDVENEQRAALKDGRNAHGVPVEVVSLTSRASRVRTDSFNAESTAFEGIDEALALLVGKDRIKNIGDLLKHIRAARTYFKENRLSQADWDERS